MSESAGSMTPVERAIALRRVQAFRGVPMDQLGYLAAASRVEDVGVGETLFEEGEPPGSLIVILDGEASLQRGGRDFGVARAGEPLGTWSLFDDHPRKATARVTQAARILVLDREDFYDVLAEHVEITKNLVQDLVRQLLQLSGLDEENSP